MLNGENMVINDAENIILSRSELADLFMVDPKYINELTRDKGLPKEDNNKYNLFNCVKWFIEYKKTLHNDELKRLNDKFNSDHKKMYIKSKSDLLKLDNQDRISKYVNKKGMWKAYLEYHEFVKLSLLENIKSISKDVFNIRDQKIIMTKLYDLLYELRINIYNTINDL